MLGALAERCLARPRATTLAVAVVTLAAASFLPGVRTEFGYRPLLGADHPAIARLEGFIERFGGGLPIRVAWRCEDGAPCASAFDEPSLRMAARVSDALEGIPEVNAVRSPAGTALLVPDAQGIAVRRLVEDGRPAPDREALARRALLDPLWRGNLVSADGRAGVLVVQPADAESATSERVVEALLAALAPFEAQGFTFHLAGHAVEFVVAGRELAASSAALTPVTAIVVALVLFALTRSWQAVLATLVTLAAALVWTFGLLGALRWPQDAILQALAPLVLVTGVCDAIHLLARHGAERRTAGARAARRGTLGRAARAVAGPCLVTSATTGLALLSFATSDLATFVHFGVVAAAGVVACLVLTFTLLPVLLAALPEEAPPRPADSAWEDALGTLVEAARRRRAAILGVAAVIAALGVAGWALRLRVDTDGVEMYGEQSRVVRWIRFVERHLGRADTLELEIALPEDVALESPETLRAVEALGDSLARVEGLGPAASVVEPVAWLNRLLHGDDPAAQRVAATAAGNAELLEIAGFEDPTLLEPWVTFDRRRLRLSLQAEFESAARRGAVLAQVRDVVARELPPGFEVALTGPFAVGHEWVRDVQATQLRSFATAFALVFVVVALALRSPGLAALALVPTLLPAVVLLGAMGLLGLSLDVGRAMIAAVLLGIGVDDAVHLLSHYRTRRRAGDAPADALRRAVVFTCRAVVTTSLALALGFLSLMVSSWQTVSSFGFFVALGIGGALLADLLVLPALLSLVVEPRERT